MIGIKKQTAQFKDQAKRLEAFGRMVRKKTNRQTMCEKFQDTLEELLKTHPVVERTVDVGLLAALKKCDSSIRETMLPGDEIRIGNKKWWQFWKKEVVLTFPPRRVTVTYVQRGMANE